MSYQPPYQPPGSALPSPAVGYPAPQPPKKSNTGCIIAAVVVAVLGIGAVGLFLVGALFLSAASTSTMTGTPSVGASEAVTGTEAVTRDGSTVGTPCYTFTVPAGYDVEPASAGCTVAVNIPGGDALSRIEIRPNAGTGTASEALTAIKAELGKDASITVKAADVVTLDQGNLAADVSFETSTLLREIFAVPTKGRTYVIAGKAVDGFMIGGSAYNKELDGALHAVANSFQFK